MNAVGGQFDTVYKEMVTIACSRNRRNRVVKFDFFWRTSVRFVKTVSKPVIRIVVAKFSNYIHCLRKKVFARYE